MMSNRLTVAVLGLACITAAGVGGYVATRHNAADAPLAAAAPEAAPAAVQETEGTVPPAEAASAPAAPASPAAETKQASAAPARAAASRTERRANTVKSQSRPAPRRDSQASSPAAPIAPLPAEQSVAAVPAVPPAPPAEDRPLEPFRDVEPPAKTFTELVVPADSVIGLRIETPLSSERARVEDRVEARVARDVRVAGDVAIPAGSRALGTVVVVDRGGKFKERARLGIRFQLLVLPDGSEHPISTDTIFRYGDAPGNGTAAKIGGGAVAGAILGAIIGGGKGAAVGASTGAGAGTAAVVAGDRSTASFPAGAEITARILSPVSFTVEHE